MPDRGRGGGNKADGDEADVSAVLRDFRQARRRRFAGRSIYPAYVVALVVLLYGATAAGPAIQALRRSRPDPGQLTAIATALPGMLTAVVALVLLAVLRTATWHGPVALSAPDAQWLLPLPVDRAVLLRYRAHRALLLWPLAGAALGALAGVFLGILLTTRLGGTVAAGAAAGALLGPAVTAGGVLVERSGRLARAVLSGTPLVVLVALALGGTGAISPTPGRVVWWTGPWGWSAVVVAQATGGATVAPVAWALLVLTALASVVTVHLLAPGVPAQRLRKGAGTAEALSVSLALGDTRDAAVVIASARPTARHRLRLPAPRWPGLVVPWRDAVALLRTPGRVGATVLFVSAAAATLALAERLHGATHGVVTVLGAALGLAAASRAAEPARLDADDPRRSGALPQPFDQLAVLHAITPTALVTLLALGAAVVTAAVAHLSVGPALLVAACSGPLLVTAVLASVFRGRAPLYLAFSGGDVGGMGSAGVPLLVLWFFAPAGLGIGLLSYGLLGARPPLDAVLGTAVAVAALLAWTRSRAAAMARVGTA